MARYVLIESRDPFEWADVSRSYATASGLAKQGDQVTLFLVQNGVLPARRCQQSKPLEALAKEGVTVLADEFSLRERGIDAGALAAGIKAAPIDTVVDQLADGRKALFY